MTPGTERWLEQLQLARIRSIGGGWLTLDGARLQGPKGDSAAVIIAPTQPSRIVGLLIATYDLTSREEEVARHVLQGLPTTGIARTLGISAHTVQEHLKRIFAKTAVRSCGELVASVFFSHYEPRVRDNEHRAAHTRPILGQPVTRIKRPPGGAVGRGATSTASDHAPPMPQTTTDTA